MPQVDMTGHRLVVEGFKLGVPEAPAALLRKEW